MSATATRPSESSQVETTQAPPREQTAGRLLDSSQKHSFDPTVDIDWDADLLDGTFFHPPELSSLYGTDLWDQMSRQQRIELTRHQVASIASVGIWFETILSRMLLRYTYGLDPTTSHARFGLTEVGDECRHSNMFARMIEKLGCPAYGPGRTRHMLGRVMSTPITNHAAAFAGTLYVEEVLDAMQREEMAADDIQPLVRSVSKIHVVEESRHMRYAEEEMARQWETMSAVGRVWTRAIVPLICKLATDALIHPRVYAAAGLDVDEALASAADNPRWQETRVWAARKPIAEFEDVGIITERTRPLWRWAGLVE